MSCQFTLHKLCLDTVRQQQPSGDADNNAESTTAASNVDTSTGLNGSGTATTATIINRTVTGMKILNTVGIYLTRAFFGVHRFSFFSGSWPELSGEREPLREQSLPHTDGEVVRRDVRERG